MKAFLTPLALAVLVAVPVVADPIQLSLSGGIDYSDNLEKIPNGDSGSESLLAVTLAYSDNLGRNEFDANYTLAQRSFTGADLDSQTALTGVLSAVLPLNERISVLLGHTAERLSTDPSAPNTTDNETLTQSVSLGFSVNPLNPGRAQLIVDPVFRYSEVTDGPGETVSTRGAGVSYQYGLNPITTVAPFIRYTTTEPEISQSVDSITGGVRFDRRLRQLSYFAEFGFGETENESGVRNDDNEYSLGFAIERGSMAVTANVTRSIQTARAASLDPGLAALLGLPLISVSQSTTDNQGISLELRQLCQRCIATVDYAQIEQRFADGTGSDIESDLGSIGLDYRLTPTSSVNLSYSREDTGFSASPSNDFVQENWSMGYSQQFARELSLRFEIREEAREGAVGADDYEALSASLSLRKVF